MSGKKKRVLLILLIAGGAFLTAVIVYFGICACGKHEITSARTASTARFRYDFKELMDEGDSPDIDVITYHGDDWHYKKDMTTILFLGVDSMDPLPKEPIPIGSGAGQTDAIFLACVDSANEELYLIAIPRDAIADLEIYNPLGEYVTNAPAQITLQYAYGDGLYFSCELAERAVSRMLCGLPIDGYMSIRMGAIPLLNDAIGGVQVEILDTIDSDPIKNEILLKKGEFVRLTGEQAFAYIHYRDINEDYSAIRRLDREKQYMAELMRQTMLRRKKNPFVFADLYRAAEDYLVTDLTVPEMVWLDSQVVECEFTNEHFYTLAGEQKKGFVYEEFEIDEGAMKELLLNVFYEKESDIDAETR